GIEIRVPENVTLRGSGSGIMGGYDVEARESEDPDAPVVVVRGGLTPGAARGRSLRAQPVRAHHPPQRRQAEDGHQQHHTGA
ncbi:hypothetical protein ACG5V6_29275, partial [Streptomyces chitinivorans]